MANLINISQIRQDQLSGFFQTPLTSATGVLYTYITGNAVQTGTFDNLFVHKTGVETISGVKTFDSRPIFAGTGFLISGEPLSQSQTGQLTGYFYPRSGNPSGYTSVSVTGSNSIFVANFTGVGGAQIILSGFNILISGGAASAGGGGGAGSGVSFLAATGSINTGGFTGNVLLSGAGNLTTFTGNNASRLIVISGDTGAYGNFVSLSQTGGFLTLGNVGGVRAITATGSYPSGIISGAFYLSGIGNITVTTGVNNGIVISGDTGAYSNFVTPSQTGLLASSGNLQATGSNLQGQINTLSSQSSTGQAVIFDSGIQINVSRQSFMFPITFNLPPYVVTQIKHIGPSGGNPVTVGVSGVTTSGFTGIFNTGISTTGYSLTIYAASGAFAPTVISPTNVRGVSFFTSYAITGNFLQEAFIPTQLNLTGYTIGCTSTGVGGAHQNSGASGLILQYPLTGSFYQRDSNNNTSTITGFTFDSGIFFKVSGFVSTIVTGLNRVGLSVVSGLSGIQNLTFSLNGFV